MKNNRKRKRAIEKSVTRKKYNKVKNESKDLGLGNVKSSIDVDSYNKGLLPNNFTILKSLDQYMIGHKGFIAGGVFKNIFNKEKFKDVDIFFYKQSDYEEAVKYYTEKDDYTEAYKNDRVVAFYNKQTSVTVELIKFAFGTVDEILKMFDFTIVKFAYYKEETEDSVEWKVTYHKQFFEHLHLRRLVIDQKFDEISRIANTYNRMFRYGKYGYFPCRETKVKVVQALRLLPDFTDDMLSQDLYFGFD